MPHITLIRHGQANSEARDETGYDRLSDLGHQQSRWLGAHFESTGETFSRIISGTLRRQLETAQSMGAERHAPLITDARLNELPYFTMSQMMQTQHGLPLPETREAYIDHLPRVFGAWEQDRIADAPESYSDFCARIDALLDEIANSPGRAMLVTSGGVIATILRRILNLDVNAWSHIALTIMNSSVHRLHVVNGRPALAHFNAIPHLETRERQFAQTHL